ncbi:MAG: hypothetical protein ACJ8C4_04010 [Gemmataceae bacterium]
MRKTRNVKLNLLNLESRLTPSVSATLKNGNLSIVGDGNSNTILIAYHGATTDIYAVNGYDAQAGANALSYELPSNKVTNFKSDNSQVNNIRVTDSNKASNPDAVVLTMDDGTTLAGSFRLNSGKGYTDLQIQTRNNTNATIGGTVELFGGDGADNFFIFDTTVNGKVTANGGKSGFRVLTDPMFITGLNPTGQYKAYGDVFQMSDCTFNSDVTVSAAVTLVDSNFGPNFINGNLRVTNSANSPLGTYRTMNGLVYPDGGLPGGTNYSGLVVLDQGTVVTGNFIFQGSQFSDGIYIDGTVTGNVNVAGQNGPNDFFLGEQRTAPALSRAATIGGNVSYTGGNGVDHVYLNDGTTVDGSVNLNVGGGDNVYDLDHGFVVGQDFRLTAGNGVDNVGVLSGMIGRDVWVNLGNGDNTIEFAFDNSNASPGSNGTDISYTGGSGVDSVTLNGNYRTFKGSFGAGNDFFGYAAGSSLSVSFYGAFGGGTDTYDRSLVSPTWLETYTNAEVVL